MNTVHIGDVFVHTWGYNCTIHDFYQVVRKTAKSVEVIHLKTSNTEGDNNHSYFVKPILHEEDTYYRDIRARPKLYRVNFSEIGMPPSIKIANYSFGNYAYKEENVKEKVFLSTRY